MRIFLAGALCAVILCLASCANREAHTSIASVSVSWLTLKSEIIHAEQSGDLADNDIIEDFRLALKKFEASPFIYLYRIHRPENIQILADINSAVDRLNAALKEGRPLLPILQEIDSGIEQLWLIEKSLSDASQLQYFQFLFFLSVFIITVVFALRRLYGRLKKTEKREKQSLDFSRETIIAQEQERSRVSRELHDTVLPLVRDAQVSAMIRSICVELMPPDFTRLSLNDSLAGLCVQFTKRSGVECACSIEEGLTFAAYSHENRLHVYRMVQESFTNIEKHSNAGRAALVVRHSDENILICVSDDGQGLQSKTGLRSKTGLHGEGKGLGMKSMRQRADILGAKLDFVSESGNGLMVRIELPPSPPLPFKTLF